MAEFNRILTLDRLVERIRRGSDLSHAEAAERAERVLHTIDLGSIGPEEFWDFGIAGFGIELPVAGGVGLRGCFAVEPTDERIVIIVEEYTLSALGTSVNWGVVNPGVVTTTVFQGVRRELRGDTPAGGVRGIQFRSGSQALPAFSQLELQTAVRQSGFHVPIVLGFNNKLPVTGQPQFVAIQIADNQTFTALVSGYVIEISQRRT